MYKSLVWASALMLAAAIEGPVLAQGTTPAPAPTPAPAASQNAMQLNVKLDDPTMCGNQLDPANPNVATYAYIKIFDNVAYPIAKGDHLVYDVMIPKASTMAAGAVDFNLDGTPNKGGGSTLRDFPDALDQWGLFAHPASNYDTLSTRLIPSVDASGKVANVPVFQRDTWYHRDIDISKLRVQSDLTTPVSLTQVMLAIDEHDVTHENDVCPTDTKNPNVTALFRNVNIVNTDATGKVTVKKAIYNGEAKLPNGVAATDANTDNTGAPGFSKTTGNVAVVPYTPATNPTAGQ